jgi:tRNA pseudouridine38-40 synthase
MIVEYDGTDYRGLQRQIHDTATIQGRIEDAVRKLGTVEPHFVASGRTDTGVHALGQVIAVSVPTRMSAWRLLPALHAMLPDDIRIRRLVDCDPDFNPRFDAIRRTYQYRVSALAYPSPLERRHVARIHLRLDPDLVNEATASFVGQWELREWRASICQAKRTRLNIDEARAEPPNDDRHHWRITFSARSFLHHQVRFMVGGVVAVAAGKLSLQELREALSVGVRPKVVVMQPACGLCLARVDFLRDKDPFATASDSTPRSES